MRFVSATLRWPVRTFNRDADQVSYSIPKNNYSPESIQLGEIPRVCEAVGYRAIRCAVGLEINQGLRSFPYKALQDAKLFEKGAETTYGRV